MYDDQTSPVPPQRESGGFWRPLLTLFRTLACLLQVFRPANRKSLPDGSLHIPSATLRLAETGSYGGKGGKNCRAARSGGSTQRNDKIDQESLSKEAHGRTTIAISFTTTGHDNTLSIRTLENHGSRPMCVPKKHARLHKVPQPHSERSIQDTERHVISSIINFDYIRAENCQGHVLNCRTSIHSNRTSIHLTYPH